MNIRTLIGDRAFGTLRNDVRRFLKHYNGWRKAANLGGAETVEKVIDKVANHPMASIMVGKVAENKVGGGPLGALAGKVASFGGVRPVLAIASSKVIGSYKGDRREAEDLLDQYRRIEDRLGNLPTTGSEGIAALKADTELMARLEEAYEAAEVLADFDGNSQLAAFVNSLSK